MLRLLTLQCVAHVLQDVVTRYASQTGHHVERRFGWDCHGLPVEYEIDKKLGAMRASCFLQLTLASRTPLGFSRVAAAYAGS